jgi:hypothetical protein
VLLVQLECCLTWLFSFLHSLNLTHLNLLVCGVSYYVRATICFHFLDVKALSLATTHYHLSSCTQTYGTHRYQDLHCC